MYNHFIQFVVPRIGQALVALVLYLNFLTLPFLRPLAGMPVLFFGLPLVLLAVLVWVARDPLGVGLAAAAQLCGVYAAGDLVTLLAHLAGGIVWRVWQPVWQGGAAVLGLAQGGETVHHPVCRHHRKASARRPPAGGAAQ